MFTMGFVCGAYASSQIEKDPKCADCPISNEQLTDDKKN